MEERSMVWLDVLFVVLAVVLAAVLGWILWEPVKGWLKAKAKKK